MKDSPDSTYFTTDLLVTGQAGSQHTLTVMVGKPQLSVNLT